MKKIIAIFALFALFFSSYLPTIAATKGEAISGYTADLVVLGMEQEAANQKAAAAIGALVNNMKADQSTASHNFNTLKGRVDSIPKDDQRRDSALASLDLISNDDGDGFLDLFLEIDPEQNIYLQESIAGAPPHVLPGDDFTLSQESVESGMSVVNRILIAPSRPGAVPEGDIVSDFIPQIIRQLFRFVSVIILIAFTVSGIMLIIAHGDEDLLTKAKSILYFTLIGFAFVALAFAIVKGVTDIDFFGFV